MVQHSFTERTVPVPVSVPGKRFRRFRFHVWFLRKRFRGFRFRFGSWATLLSGQNFYKINSLQTKCFGAINIVNITKESLLQSEFFGLFSCKKGHASGINITKKIFWWNYFCDNCKNNYKRKCSKELFCKNFGQDGIPIWVGANNQGKTKGQQLKGKIVSEFSHFFALFQTFSPRTSPFKTKGFSSMRTKEKKR